eukprot:SAG31_NODE_26320_length_444_cov_1.000000_1_plen_61_part_10
MHVLLLASVPRATTDSSMIVAAPAAEGGWPDPAKLPAEHRTQPNLRGAAPAPTRSESTLAN